MGKFHSGLRNFPTGEGSFSPIIALRKTLQKWARKWICFARQQPGRARQKILATKGHFLAQHDWFRLGSVLPLYHPNKVRIETSLTLSLGVTFALSLGYTAAYFGNRLSTQASSKQITHQSVIRERVMPGKLQHVQQFALKKR